ncbi:hypothetical protein PGT21_016406 [Puccinia graminis f. sp. tritici]|uniref:Uncharacterized protein n=1 Tax=Puccinia graminis f. sp. tritici TaxID=56615 RepID=A0A5B0PXQ7_PUCGR|nr:hypothetical protein PGT21_016406 [Puccinia graminis f. sp. tritici]
MRNSHHQKLVKPNLTGKSQLYKNSTPTATSSFSFPHTLIHKTHVKNRETNSRSKIDIINLLTPDSQHTKEKYKYDVPVSSSLSLHLQIVLAQIRNYNNINPTPPLESHSNYRLQERAEKAQDSDGFLGQNGTTDGSTKIDRDGRIAPSSHEEAEMVFNHPLEDGIVAEAFNHGYLDTKRIVDPTLQTLQKMARQWTPDEYLAPSTSLVATSENGKSRLLKELSRHTCVVYICLRPKDATGYPPRSEYPGGLLLDSKCPTLQTRYEELLCAILHTVADFFSAQEPGSRQERLERWILYSFPQTNRSGDPPFWTEVARKMDEISSRSARLTAYEKDAQIWEALSRMKESTQFIGQDDLRVLLAIDEASELFASYSSSPDLSFLSIFQGALQRIPSHSSEFFSILADTKSLLSTFHPTSPYYINHPYSRIGKHKHKKLFDPIYEIPTFDLHVTDPPTDQQQLQSAFRLLSYGSPFWRVYANEAKRKGLADDEIIQGLTQYTLQKLLSTSGQSVPAGSLSDSQVFALLGSTIQPSTLGASYLNAKLISSHGAQCVHLDPSQLELISGYPSQFILSSAANQYLASDEARLIRCIQVLASINRQRLFGLSDVDRLVSRIILLRAMQITIQNTPPPPPPPVVGPDSERLITMPLGHSVRLVDFLQTFTGWDQEHLELGSIDKENKERLLAEAHLFWNHFISIDHTPSSAGLLRQLYRGLAVTCRHHQPSFDQLFKIYLRSESGPTTALIDEKQITFGAVCVSNSSDDESVAQASYQWTPAHAGIKLQEHRHPYLVLNFRLNEASPKPPKSSSTKPPNSPSSSSPHIVPIPNGKASKNQARRRAGLAFYGLKAFPFLTQDLRKALQELLDSEASFRSLISDDSSDLYRKFVLQTSPGVYPASSSSSK